MNMNMASSSSMGSMASMTPTSSAAMSMSTGSSMTSMGGMDMGGGGCKISMLWNWYTVDACFLSSSWHVTSSGMFAGSCIGVISLVVVLEFLRRVGREYERFISSNAKKAVRTTNGSLSKTWDSSLAKRRPVSESSTEQARPDVVPSQSGFMGRRLSVARPTVIRQALRATIHMLQFAVAYFVMLLAMYFNGYIIISIFIGAWIGAFIFSWDQFDGQGDGDATEVTGCCG